MNPEYHANSYSLMFAYAVRPSCQLDLKLFLCIQWKLSGCAIYGKHLVACLQACDIGLLDMDSQHHTGQLHLSACLYCDNYPPPLSRVTTTWLPACKPVTQASFWHEVLAPCRTTICQRLPIL